MKTTTILLTLTTTLMLTAWGCNNNKPQAQPTNNAIITITKTQTVISGKCHYFLDYKDGELREKTMFTTKEPVKNFAYIEIEVVLDDDGNRSIYENGVLYSIDELTPEKPFVVAFVHMGHTPYRAISFTHKGVVKYYYLTYSGEDGADLLIEFTPAQR